MIFEMFQPLKDYNWEYYLRIFVPFKNGSVVLQASIF